MINADILQTGKLVPMDTHEALLQGYLSVCYKAMEVNRDRFPYGYILRACVDFEDRVVRVSFIQRQDGYLSVIFGGDEGRVWQVHEAYLRKVLECPGEYISNPARLDWEWVGLDFTASDHGRGNPTNRQHRSNQSNPEDLQSLFPRH